MLRRVVKQRKDLHFVVLYTREPHARQMAFKKIAQPLDWKERRDLARRTREELKLDALHFWIDEMGDPSRKLFGDIPNPALFIEPDGTIKDKLSWADASEVERVLKIWKPKPLPAKKPAPKKASGSPAQL